MHFSEFPYKMFVTALHDIICLRNFRIVFLPIIIQNYDVLHFFAPVLHLNCTALSQSESNNFFMCIIKVLIVGLNIFSPSCIFIPGRIPHRASVHTSCVCYDDWRARLWNNLRGYVFEPKSVESIPIHGIHFSIFVLVFVERRTDESLGKKTSSTYYDPIGNQAKCAN